MTLTTTEQALVEDFERRQAANVATFNKRVRKKPMLETLSNPSSFLRALLIFPAPWICLYTVVQLSSSHHQLDPAKFFMAFLTGYFLVDLTTGLVHMRFDTLPMRMSNDKTAMEYIAWGFQRHHALQHNWLHDDILESAILTSGFLTMPFYFVFLMMYTSGCMACPYTAFVWTVYIATGLHVQLFHAAAHNTFKGSHPRLQALFHTLASYGLVLDAKTHHEHHTKFDCNFSMISGWSNCLLNPLYRYLEANGYIHPELHGETQRQVYIHQKARITEPYCRMFPEYRHYQERR